MNRVSNDRRTASATHDRTTAAHVWLLLVIVPGCDLPGKPRLADKPIPADQVVDFMICTGKTVLAATGPMESLARHRRSTMRSSCRSSPIRSCSV